MPQLDATRRARLPDSAFAYVDSTGRRRLPINDEAHVRNALSRFNQVRFEDDAARDRARTRLLRAAKRFGIVPIGFFSGQLRSQVRAVDAGRLVVELEAIEPDQLEVRLRTILGDPSLVVLQWSDPLDGYVDGSGEPAGLPADGSGRAVTLLERDGRPMTALVHAPAVLRDADVMATVAAAVRLAGENERLKGEVEAQVRAARRLPTGMVTFLMSDIEGSTAILRASGDAYPRLLAEVRRILRTVIRRSAGHEIDARADEFFAVFERPADALTAAIETQRRLERRSWPGGLEIRLRIGLHSGRPTLTDSGYVGLAVHATARICSAGHGGQIVISDAVRRAVGEPAPAGLTFRPLGAYQLTGLAGSTSLYQVEAAGLPSRFPAPRATVARDPAG